MISLIRFHLLLSLLVLPGFGFGQSTEEAVVSVGFKMLGWSDDTIEDISYLQGDSLEEVVIPSWRRSDVDYAYRGSATMKFYSKKDTEAAPVATVDLQPGVRHYTIMMLTQGGQYKALAIPDDPEHSPVGKARVINFSKYKIALQANGENVAVLNPREQVVVAPNTDNNLLKVKMAYEEDGQWRQAGLRRYVISQWQQTTIFYVTMKAEFFKSGTGASGDAPQPFVLQQAAPRGEESNGFFKSGTGQTREGPQSYLITQ